MARQPLGGLGRLIFRGFTITLFGHTTLGRTPLDEGPARRRDLYLTTHKTHKRQTSMPPVGFEPTILVSEQDFTEFYLIINAPILHNHRPQISECCHIFHLSATYNYVFILQSSDEIRTHPEHRPQKRQSCPGVRHEGRQGK
jgi:hypothetical protein